MERNNWWESVDRVRDQVREAVLLNSTAAFVYALADPSDGRIFYVGKSADPVARYRMHLSRYAASQIIAWVRLLKVSGLEPELRLLRILPDLKSAGIAEQELIRELRPRLNSERERFFIGLRDDHKAWIMKNRSLLDISTIVEKALDMYIKTLQ